MLSSGTSWSSALRTCFDDPGPGRAYQFGDYTIASNTINYGEFSAAELKTMQEVITLIVFGVFSVLYSGEPLKWTYLVGFLFIVAAVFFVFHKW